MLQKTALTRIWGHWFIFYTTPKTFLTSLFICSVSSSYYMGDPTVQPSKSVCNLLPPSLPEAVMFFPFSAPVVSLDRTHCLSIYTFVCTSHAVPLFFPFHAVDEAGSWSLTLHTQPAATICTSSLFLHIRNIWAEMQGCLVLFFLVYGVSSHVSVYLYVKCLLLIKLSQGWSVFVRACGSSRYLKK